MLPVTGNDVAEVGPDSKEVAPEVERVEDAVSVGGVWSLGSHHHTKQAEDLEHLSQDGKFGGAHNGLSHLPVGIGRVLQVGADRPHDRETGNGNEHGRDCTGVNGGVEQTSKRTRQDAVDQPTRHSETNDTHSPTKNLERSRCALTHLLRPINEIDPRTSNLCIARNEAHIHTVYEHVATPVVIVLRLHVPSVDPVSAEDETDGQGSKETEEKSVRGGIHFQSFVLEELSRDEDVGMHTGQRPNNGVQVESANDELGEIPRGAIG